MPENKTNEEKTFDYGGLKETNEYLGAVKDLIIKQIDNDEITRLPQITKAFRNLINSGFENGLIDVKDEHIVENLIAKFVEDCWHVDSNYYNYQKYKKEIEEIEQEEFEKEIESHLTEKSEKSNFDYIMEDLKEELEEHFENA